MDKISTHQLPLAEFQSGLDLVASGKESIKVALLPTPARPLRGLDPLRRS